jgi:serine/threonine protein phosphatase PrpC
VLTRTIGTPVETIESDLDHRDIEVGERLLLCSDGLTKVASEAVIADTPEAHPTSEAACRARVDLALTGGGPDKMTVIVACRTVTCIVAPGRMRPHRHSLPPRRQ